ncbi:MFS general substrate transporter [Roridomyces roridus]|uniref:MFS general substrate transporter n=1 Tax=Roridomyces roridus TaxID=1738132 RepID=A0AAD7B6S4_9AGAR|nr:MFS general substrate transporter [Roridomyces roridus]
MSQTPTSDPKVDDTKAPDVDDALAQARASLRFWLVFIALCFCVLLSALDLGGVSTAAPMIVAELHGTDFSWVGSAYTLSSAACLPFAGNLAQIFGRRPVTLVLVLIFAIGSAVSGSSKSMTALIVGRAIQGVGGGGLQTLVYIVNADLVPLRKRGIFTGITGLVWTLGTVVGPVISGSLTEKASWRWLFYMNLPLCALAFLAVALFLDLKKPEGDIRSKIVKIDWIGNILIIASSTSCMLGLTWGGGRFPWSSAQVLAPVIIGVIGLGVTLVYEIRFASRPTIPKTVISNPGSLLGYFAAFIHGVITLGVTFYLPTWFQSVHDATPIQSGIYFLPMAASISPAAIVQGLLIAKLGHYRLINLIGWSAVLLGLGLFITLDRNTSLGVIVVFQIIQGVGMGLLYALTFVVLAPLPVSENASAVSLLSFVRAFSQSWGVAIAGSVISNKLASTLPSSILEQFDRASLVYGVIPEIAGLPEPLQDQVKDVYVESIRVMWIVMAVLAAVGFLTVLFMKDIPLSRTVDGKWGLKKPAEKGKTEKAEVGENSEEVTEIEKGATT